MWVKGDDFIKVMMKGDPLPLPFGDGDREGKGDCLITLRGLSTIHRLPFHQNL
jgi:hypothetical protein